MRTPIKIALVALMLAGGSFAAGQPAMADNVTVDVNGGGIAFGYTDGYWDRAHNWHAWQNAQAAAAWRAQNREHYYEWKHDRDASMGWREERYWETH